MANSTNASQSNDQFEMEINQPDVMLNESGEIDPNLAARAKSTMFAAKWFLELSPDDQEIYKELIVKFETDTKAKELDLNSPIDSRLLNLMFEKKYQKFFFIYWFSLIEEKHKQLQHRYDSEQQRHAVQIAGELEAVKNLEQQKDQLSKQLNEQTIKANGLQTSLNASKKEQTKMKNKISALETKLDLALKVNEQRKAEIDEYRKLKSDVEIKQTAINKAKWKRILFGKNLLKITNKCSDIVLGDEADSTEDPLDQEAAIYELVQAKLIKVYKRLKVSSV